jgi:hypothetical protein
MWWVRLIVIIVGFLAIYTNTDVSICVILVNAIISIVIVILREDPLSTGMLDIFFPKNLIMCLFY